MSMVMNAPTKHKRLLAWVEEIAALTEPDAIHWFDGSDEEHALLCKQLVDAGTFTELDPVKRPGSYWAHTDPSDVARVEDRTFICSAREEDAGPTNNWKDPAEMRGKLDAIESGLRVAIKGDEVPRGASGERGVDLPGLLRGDRATSSAA